MHWPGTAAVLEGTAEVEAGIEPESVRAGGITGTGAGAVTSPVAVAGVPSGRGLPCAGDPELFFAESPQDVEYAKSLCLSCQARIACLSGAVERREPWGVWGG